MRVIEWSIFRSYFGTTLGPSLLLPFSPREQGNYLHQQSGFFLTACLRNLEKIHFVASWHVTFKQVFAFRKEEGLIVEGDNTNIVLFHKKIAQWLCFKRPLASAHVERSRQTPSAMKFMRGNRPLSRQACEVTDVDF